MKRKFTKITALLVTVALLMAVPTLSAYANEENTTAVLSESAAQSTTNNIKESTTVPEDRQTTDNQESTTQPPTTEPVKEEIESIRFTVGESCKIGVKEPYQLCLKNQDNKTVKDGITYKSSNNSVVSVDKNGKIIGKKAGIANITAETENGKTSVCKINVVKAATGLKLNITSASIGISEKSVDLDSTLGGGYSRLRQYSSSNPKIASVDGDGIVTGIKEGTATITCVTFNGIKATCKITVGKKPTSIKITNKNNVIQKGSDNHRITYSLSKGAYSYRLTYSVKDKSIATIDSNGYITGRKRGKTTVTVKTYNGLTATQNITVNDDSLSLNVKSTQIALDNKNVKKVKYGTSVQGRNLEAFIINGSDHNSLNQECKIKANSSVNIRSGPGTSYSIVSSVKNGTKVTRIAKSVKKANGYTWDKIVLSNKKEGYIASKYLVLVKDNTPVKKTLFMDFAIHGFEDEYYRDGQVLVNEANALIEYFSVHTAQLKNYTLVIVPCANPDGVIAGTNNQRACNTAFGRCTANHIDINRDWGSFRAVETRALRDFIKQCKPTFYLNIHGWLNETLGDSNLNAIISKELGLAKKMNNNYPSNYAIGWVHKNLKIPATLVEYKSSSSVSTQKDIKMIKAIINSNGKAPASANSSTNKFPTPANWKNGSTPEPVYNVSNLAEKSDSLKAKASAKCYRKSGNSYVIVYNYGSKNHKAGFVKYAGGIKKAPTDSKTYKNKSSSQAVYADTAKKTKIGSLDSNERCVCLGKIDGMYLVLYNVTGTNKQKSGFVSYNGGC